ncbi:hypothetical protein JXC34_03300 [Candidatus Woesearchaeota archaeon]|nr:hypothetical protein [Candidatus Woesearchaeota archaeon]
MISAFEQVEELTKEINKILETRVKLYIIGGAALLYREMKTATKDIDAIVIATQEFMEFQKALEKLGFKKKLPGKEYSRMKLSQIFERKEFRIDLFEKEVCRRFSLSGNMIKRAEQVINLDKVKVFLCSNEDIFLFKTITERPGDILDCINLASTTEFDWNIVLQELKDQTSKQEVWITWIGERFDLLEDRGLVIPIKKELDKLIKKFFKNLERGEKNAV